MTAVWVGPQAGGVRLWSGGGDGEEGMAMEMEAYQLLLPLRRLRSTSRYTVQSSASGAYSQFSTSCVLGVEFPLG